MKLKKDNGDCNSGKGNLMSSKPFITAENLQKEVGK